MKKKQKRKKKQKKKKKEKEKKKKTKKKKKKKKKPSWPKALERNFCVRKGPHLKSFKAQERKKGPFCRRRRPLRSFGRGFENDPKGKTNSRDRRGPPSTESGGST